MFIVELVVYEAPRGVVELELELLLLEPGMNNPLELVSALERA
jgi:hypothetical protein